MAGKFPNLKKTHMEVLEGQWTLTKNVKKTILRHTIIKFLKTSDKEKILKSSREKRHITYKRIKVKITIDFLLQTMKTVSRRPGGQKWKHIILKIS